MKQLEKNVLKTESEFAGDLACDVCKKTQDCNFDEVLSYLDNGWPECCNQMMSLKKLDEEMRSV